MISSNQAPLRTSADPSSAGPHTGLSLGAAILLREMQSPLRRLFWSHLWIRDEEAVKGFPHFDASFNVKLPYAFPVGFVEQIDTFQLTLNERDAARIHAVPEQGLAETGLNFVFVLGEFVEGALVLLLCRHPNGETNGDTIPGDDTGELVSRDLKRRPQFIRRGRLPTCETVAGGTQFRQQILPIVIACLSQGGR